MLIERRKLRTRTKYILYNPGTLFPGFLFQKNEEKNNISRDYSRRGSIAVNGRAMYLVR